MTKGSRGATIIEVLMVAGIVGILLSIGLANIPAQRDREALQQSEQLIRRKLAEAREKALQENREHVCLPNKISCLDSSPDQEKNCSDIGVTVKKNEIILFANISDSAQIFDTGDCVISRDNFPGSVTVESTRDITTLITAIPPSLTTTRTSPEINLQSNSSSVTLEVSETGHIRRKK